MDAPPNRAGDDRPVVRDTAGGECVVGSEGGNQLTVLHVPHPECGVAGSRDEMTMARAEITRCPSGVAASATTGPPCEAITGPSAPLSMSHNRTAPSAEAETARVPPARTATCVTGPVCPRRIRCSAQSSVFQTRSVRSSDAEMIRRLSGERATAFTAPW